ncbi:MAG: hypothetical protein AB7I09_19965 [Planctomycetota bacterium]
MNSIHCFGLDGSNPLGFLAALGLLRIVPRARLGFSDDGSFHAILHATDLNSTDLPVVVARDAQAEAEPNGAWRLTYTKAATKSQGPQTVADLKAPPSDFRRFLATSIDRWIGGEEEAAAYAASYGTDVAVDGKGNTKPTAFHFTAAQQTFLGTVDAVRSSVTQEWTAESLFEGHGQRSGPNLRWDPGAERNWALMASNPSGDGTRVDAPVEWLAFRGLPLLPSFPYGKRITTTAVVGRSDHMRFSWPLWSVSASLDTVRSVLLIDWHGRPSERSTRGIFAICTSSIRRTSQGFGNFGPSSVAN